MKKIAAMLLVLCLLIAAVTANAEEKAVAGHKVGFIQLTLVSNYHAAMSDHFEEIAKAAGLDAVMTNGEWKTDSQLQLCEDLIAQGCEAIILNPVGDEVVPIVLSRCQDAGIPLICVDNTSPGVGYTYIGIDNFAISRGIGEYVGEKYGQGNIVYLRSTANDTGCPAYRFGGFFGGLSDEGEVAGYKLIDERYALQDVDQTEGMRQMEELLAANDNIDIVLCHRDGLMLGALIAIKNAARTDVKVVTGFDGEKAALEAIKTSQGGANGPDVVTGLNSPIKIADMTLEVLNNYFAGEALPASYYTPVVVANYNNVDQYMDYGF